MKISDLFPYTSRMFTVESVLSEVKELLHATTKEEVVEEVKDVVTTALLFFYAKTKIDVWIPSIFTSAEKYIHRMSICREVLKQEKLYDADRERKEPLYFARYTGGGSNMDRPEKRKQFIKLAARDFIHRSPFYQEGNWYDPNPNR